MIPIFDVRLLVETQELRCATSPLVQRIKRESADILSSLHFDSSSQKEILGIRADGSTKDPYLPFVDGFPFKHNVGRSKQLAEVFTPRWLAEDMWSASNPNRKKMFREFDYSEISLKELGLTNFEPAIGTGNITCSLLWHRINYAWIHTLGVSEFMTLEARNKTFAALMTYALSRFYGCDIDSGSLQVLKYRLLGGDIFSAENVDFWTEQALFFTDPFTSTKNDIREKVTESLKTAQVNWYDPNWRGSLIRQYEYYTDEKVPEGLLSAWHKVVNYNFFLSNVIHKTSDFDMNALVPGYVAVEEVMKGPKWGWLNVDDYSISLDSK